MEMEQHREEAARLRTEYEQFKKQSEKKIAEQVARADNEVQARALLKSINDFLKKKVEELKNENN